MDKCFGAITHDEQKAINGFQKEHDFYYKVIETTYPNIQYIYDINFYVDYIDEKQTMKLVWGVTRWCINDNSSMHKLLEIEKDECRGI